MYVLRSKLSPCFREMATQPTTFERRKNKKIEDEAANGTDNTSMYIAQFPQKNANHLLVQRTSLVPAVP